MQSMCIAVGTRLLDASKLAGAAGVVAGLYCLTPWPPEGNRATSDGVRLCRETPAAGAGTLKIEKIHA